MQKIGIMGGTFNPVHAGHLLLAEWAMDEAGLDEVWLIPTGISYMKVGQKIPAGEERLHMLKLAAEDNPRLRCLDTEIKRQGYTYTYETLELLKKEHPDKEFYFIVGADCLFAIKTWKSPERILNSCTLIAAARNGSPLEEMEKERQSLLEKYGGKIMLMPFVSISLTSTEIRERIMEGKSVRYLVPEKTLSYIKEKGLYSNEKM